MLRRISAAGCFLLLICSLPVAVFSQEEYREIEPWEAEDVLSLERLAGGEALQTSPFIALAGTLIGFYQKEIGPRSVSRCPFHISCSEFARRAILKHGLVLGLALYIDRNLYRENSTTHWYYPYREAGAGLLKLDDGFYLHGPHPATDRRTDDE